LTASLLGVLEWIEENKDDATDKFHHAGIEARVQQCIDEWKKIAAFQKEKGNDETKYLEGLAKLDFGEFWLMILVQICCVGKVVVIWCRHQTQCCQIHFHEHASRTPCQGYFWTISGHNKDVELQDASHSILCLILLVGAVG
jgi:hypothetical protein